MTERTVREVMTGYVITAAPTTTFQDLVVLLADHDISAVPVVGPDAAVLGVVSDTDLLTKQEFHGGADPLTVLAGPATRRRHHKAEGITAAELMTSPALTIGPDEPIATAARRLGMAKVRRLIVVDEFDRPIGVISRRDLLGALMVPDAEILTAARRILTAVGRSRAATDLTAAVVDGMVTVDGVVTFRSKAEDPRLRLLALPGVVTVHSRLTFEVDDLAAAGL